MNIFKHCLRLMAIKNKRARGYTKCRLCNELIVPEEKMFYVYRWSRKKSIVKICYCMKCMPTRKDVLNEVDTDSIPYGIANVDDYDNFEKKDYTRYLKRKEREKSHKKSIH